MRIDGHGRVALATGEADIAESIRIIILTAPGERPMRPRFGCAIWDSVYAPLNVATLSSMAFAVRAALAEWEPRVVVDDVNTTIDPDSPSTVHIAISYRIRATNDPRNLVFPFYVIPEEGT